MKRLATILFSVLLISPAVASAQTARLSHDGILNVHGTDRSDTIKINVINSWIGRLLRVEVKDDRFRTTRFSFMESDVDLISVFALDGDDTVVNETNIRSWQWGGKGDDRLQGGSNDDQLNGDEGVDLLLGGPGSDLLIAGPYTFFLGSFLDGGPGLDEFRYNYWDWVIDHRFSDDNINLDGTPSKSFSLPDPDFIRNDGTWVLTEASLR